MGGLAIFPFFMFNFNLRRKFKSAIVGIVCIPIIIGISKCTNVPEEQIYDVVDEFQRKLPDKPLNDRIILNPILLNRRIKRDVDRAIRDVTPEYDWIISDYDKKYQPRYIEEKNDETLCYTDECKALAPPMRLCAPWLDDCPEK